MSTPNRLLSKNRAATRPHTVPANPLAASPPLTSPHVTDQHESTTKSPDVSQSVCVAESTIAGKGVFALIPFNTGDRILRFDDSHQITPCNPLRPELGEVDDYVDHLANGVQVFMYEPERYLNHRCNPNSFCRHFNGVRYLVARQPIAVGEEVVVDYALNSAVPGYTWLCECGAHNCRKVGYLDFFQLPAHIQRDYFGMLDGWFVTEYRERLNTLAEHLSRPPI